MCVQKPYASSFHRFFFSFDIFCFILFQKSETKENEKEQVKVERNCCVLL